MNKFLPLVLIYLFIIWFLYYCYKFLLPYLKGKQICLGLKILFKQIVKYIWSQKIMFLLLFLIPNFSLIITFYNCLLNYLTVSNFNLLSFVINYMFLNTGGSKNLYFKSFVDVASSLKLLKINPILDTQNVFKNERLPSSLLYRAWYRTPTYYRKLIYPALEWTKKQGFHDIHENLAFIQSNGIIQQNPVILSDSLNLLLRDMGHKGLVKNDEMIVAILVAQQLNKRIEHVPYFINGFAVDFKLTDGQETIYFEVKPGYNICREKLNKAWQLMISQLSKEEQNTQLGNKICLVYECSDSSYIKVLQLREMIKKNHFENRIILTHKTEGQYIQNVIIENNNILVQSDCHIQPFISENISDITTKCWNSQPSNKIPSFDSSMEESFYEVSELLEKRYQYPPDRSNNGYETLQDNMLDELFNKLSSYMIF